MTQSNAGQCAGRKFMEIDWSHCSESGSIRSLNNHSTAESRPGRDRAIPGSLDAHPADAGRAPALQIALACVPPARSIPNPWKGWGLPGLLSLRGVLAVKACARAKRPCSRVAARALTAALRRVVGLHRQSAGIEAGEHHA